MLNQLRIKKTFIVRHVIWKLKSYHNRLIQYQTEWVYGTYSLVCFHVTIADGKYLF